MWSWIWYITASDGNVIHWQYLWWRYFASYKDDNELENNEACIDQEISQEDQDYEGSESEEDKSH